MGHWFNHQSSWYSQYLKIKYQLEFSEESISSLLIILNELFRSDGLLAHFPVISLQILWYKYGVWKSTQYKKK